MKNRLLIFACSLMTGLFIFTFVSESFAQTKKSEIQLSFQRQKNGKIVRMNASEQKEFVFLVQGLTTQTDVDNFKFQFEGKEHVISIKISEPIAESQRKGSVLFDQTAKGPYFIELLKGAGINTISIDGELKSVDELGKDKKAPGNTRQK